MNEEFVLTEVSYIGAIKLFDEGQEVFLIYDDNTESLVERTDDIILHDGRYGIEIGDLNEG